MDMQRRGPVDENMEVIQHRLNGKKMATLNVPKDMT